MWHQVLKLILFFSFFPFSICFKIGRSEGRWKNFWEKINDKGNNLFRCIVFLNEILDRYANIFNCSISRIYSIDLLYRIVVFLGKVFVLRQFAARVTEKQRG